MRQKNNPTRAQKLQPKVAPKVIAKQPQFKFASIATPNFWWEKVSNQYIIVFLLAFIVYGNTMLNEYALDDVMVFTNNAHVQKGIAGIGKLITKDSFHGFIGDQNDLPGGRWRPLSLITFALEVQFFKSNTAVSHFINVLIYALTGIFLIRFLRKHLFPEQLILPLIISAIYILHPIHTEAIANIKSRDELLSFLLLVLTMDHALDYVKGTGTAKSFLKAMVFFALACLAKENVLMFIFILPLTFYFFANMELMASVKKSVPFYVLIGLYLVIRTSVTSSNVDAPITEITNAYFLYATPIQAFATKILCLGIYFKLLFFPYPLSSDYSFSQIPYVDFTSIWVILTLLAYGVMFYFGVKLFKKRSLISYCIWFYLFSMFIVSNFVVDIGAALGERFEYQASLAFAILLGYFLYQAYQKIAINAMAKKIVFATFTLIIVSGTSAYCIHRNAQWKNNNTLFLRDVLVNPNSAKTNLAAGISLINLEPEFKDFKTKKVLVDKAIKYLNRALEIHPIYVDAFINMGVAYSRINEIETAEIYWTKGKNLNPRHPKFAEIGNALSGMYLNKAVVSANQKNYKDAFRFINKSVSYNPNSYDIWYNYAGMHYSVANYDSSAIGFTNALRLNPNSADAKKGLEASNFMIQQKQALAKQQQK